MARIIESSTNSRRTIQLSTNDIISVIQDYQRLVPRFTQIDCVRDALSDIVIYLPEDI